MSSKPDHTLPKLQSVILQLLFPPFYIFHCKLYREMEPQIVWHDRGICGG